MTERCINLTAVEARAWAAGATALIRTVDVSHIGPDIRAVRWQAGDVLIGREAHVRTTIIDLDGAEQELTVVPDVVYRADSPESATSWVSASRMPKVLARFRFRVVSVHVSYGCNVSFDQAAAAIGHEIKTANDWRTALAYLGVNAGDNYVSVTMLERAT